MSTLFSTTSDDYAFTSFSTLTIPPSTTLEDPSTPAGKTWADTIEAYLSHPDTGFVWWGRLHDNPEVVKLIVDWTTPTPRTPIPDMPIQSTTTTFYNLGAWAPTRTNALSTRPGSTSALLTFHFPPSFTPTSPSATAPSRTHEELWSEAFTHFNSSVLHSAGGVVSSSSASSWSVTPPSSSSSTPTTFIAIFRYTTPDAFRQHLEAMAQKTWLEGGLERLWGMTSGGVDVEFADLWAFEEGWLGGVTQTKKEKGGLALAKGLSFRG
ncbi:hypothetical protein BDV95DRAFT_590424 [Massariosphaeria phaeospora]|uniref:ABM domain-containing protein n=1 Tax=Massariosphaeria phaeospora TaxID=100035 RepID=A0A7C8MLI7_9PLEO|nr:hypothetical protein BDV95DRAFT_590424 [Massariosphaeria phaeospora]